RSLQRRGEQDEGERPPGLDHRLAEVAHLRAARGVVAGAARGLEQEVELADALAERPRGELVEARALDDELQPAADERLAVLGEPALQVAGRRCEVDRHGIPFRLRPAQSCGAAAPAP